MQGHLASRRTFLSMLGASTALAALAGASPGRAFAEPAQGPLRILCTAPGGSIPDIVARRYAEQFTRMRGAAVVDNRAGAAGQIAVNALKQAVPDGATMLLAQGAIASIYQYLYPTLPYDPETDLKPVSVAAEATLALAVGPAVPESVRTLGEFVEWMRANPKSANYGSPGLGTLPQLLIALLFHEAKVDAQHVAYAGGPPAILDLIAGRIASLALPEGLLRPHYAAGNVRVLATSDAGRSSFMPEIPSFKEQGYPTLVIREWFGFFMPGGAPVSTLETASQQVRDAAASAPVSAALRDIGMVASAGSPAAMNERIVAERRYWREAIAATGIRLSS